jgi:hypothetical protein
MTECLPDLPRYIRQPDNGERRYGVWNGCPQGEAEDLTRCIEEVWPITGWIPYQCCRKRGHGPDGLYCKQHNKKHTREGGFDA